MGGIGSGQVGFTTTLTRPDLTRVWDCTYVSHKQFSIVMCMPLLSVVLPINLTMDNPAAPTSESATLEKVHRGTC
jgi:hypothetical protein